MRRPRAAPVIAGVMVVMTMFVILTNSSSGNTDTSAGVTTPTTTAQLPPPVDLPEGALEVAVPPKLEPRVRGFINNQFAVHPWDTESSWRNRIRPYLSPRQAAKLLAELSPGVESSSDDNKRRLANSWEISGHVVPGTVHAELGNDRRTRIITNAVEVKVTAADGSVVSQETKTTITIWRTIGKHKRWYLIKVA